MEVKRNFVPNDIYLEEQSRPLEKILSCKFCGMEKSKNEWIIATVKNNSNNREPFVLGDTTKPSYYLWCSDCDDHRHLIYDFYVK